MKVQKITKRMLKEFGKDVLKVIYPLTFPITGNLPHKIRERLEDKIGVNYEIADFAVSAFSNAVTWPLIGYLTTNNSEDVKYLGILACLDGFYRIASTIHRDLQIWSKNLVMETSSNLVESIYPKKACGSMFTEIPYMAGKRIKENLNNYLRSLNERAEKRID